MYITHHKLEFTLTFVGEAPAAGPAHPARDGNGGRCSASVRLSVKFDMVFAGCLLCGWDGQEVRDGRGIGCVTILAV